MGLVASKLEEKKEIPGPVLNELDPVFQKLLEHIFADESSMTPAQEKVRRPGAACSRRRSRPSRN